MGHTKKKQNLTYYMETIDTQTPVDYKGQLTERMKAKYPDMNFGGEDGTGGTDSLEEAIMRSLDESESNYNDVSGKLNKFTELFNSSPRSAVFLNTLAATKNPGEAFYRAYGKGAYEAYQAGNVSEFIATIEAEDAKAKAEEEQFLKEKEANLSQSIADLQAFGEERGLSLDQQVDLFMRVYNALQDAYDGKYPREIFEAMLKADSYDADVASARQEGEVDGRNARIDEMRRRRTAMENRPPQLYGQGVRTAERPIEKKQTEGDFWTGEE